MSDLQKALNTLMSFKPKDMHESIMTLQDILDRNQNPGCGGDGSMSERQWTLLREIKLCIVDLMGRMLQCAKDRGPKICETELWKRENKKKD
jgi:hypothetical protein